MLPVIAIIGVVAIVFVAGKSNSRDKRNQLPTNPGSNQTTKKDSQVQPMNEAQLAMYAANKLVGSAFSTEAAKTVATFGLAIAITVGMLNIAAGAVIAVAVLIVANIVEWIAQATEGDNHLVGLTRFGESWQKIYASFRNAVEAKIAIQQQKLDVAEFAYASAGYADGFMEWQNQLNAIRAWQGALFGPGISGGVQWTAAPNSTGYEAVKRAWKNGVLAGEDVPLVLVDSTMAVNGQVPVGTFWYSGTIQPLRNERMSLNPSFWLTTPAGPSKIVRDNPNNQNPTAKVIATNFYKMGKLHANAAGFFSALQAPVGAGQNLYAHMVNSATNGYFNGRVLVPPAIPEGIGLEVEGYVFYTRDNKTPVYIRTP